MVESSELRSLDNKTPPPGGVFVYLPYKSAKVLPLHCKNVDFVDNQHYKGITFALLQMITNLTKVLPL